MIQYTVFSANDMNKLIFKVNDALKNGWTLQGGVAMAQDQGNSTYAQAMIKETK